MFCVSCGKETRSSWLKYRGVACTQKCMAEFAWIWFRTGPETFFCDNCGVLGCGGCREDEGEEGR